ncbi:MAG: COG1361 S-layer family protein, partial [Methanothrix sp.]
MIGKGLNGRLEMDSSSHAALLLARIAFAAYLILSISSIPPALAAESGAPIPPERFSADYYKVYGTPNLTASLDMSRIYQGEATVLTMTLTNRGRITSFEINEE